MLITDIRGVTFPNCPRCGKDWELNNKVPQMENEAVTYTCTDRRCLYFNNRHERDNSIKYVLSWFSGEGHLIEWEERGTWILIYANADEDQLDGLKELTLPTIPYSITLEKLKTYLIFC
jgi:hypothetical protein